VILLPPAASAQARAVDSLASAILGADAAIAAGVAGTIVYLCVRYRAGSAAPRPPVSPPAIAALEALWILGPTALGLLFFAWGARLYVRERRPPPDALEIRVVAQRWMWKAQQPSGRREINEVHVPAGRPVRLAMTSQDVIHSFFVPALRIKQDVLPDRDTTLWFDVERPGTYPVACAQYCGTEHAGMRASLVALEPEAYGRWLSETGEDGPAPGPAERGRRLFERRACASCHAKAGGKGPPLQRVAGSAVRLRDGRVVLADDGYLRESILDPGAKLVYGYPDVMPGFRGRLSAAELADILEYLRALGRGRGEDL